MKGEETKGMGCGFFKILDLEGERRGGEVE